MTRGLVIGKFYPPHKGHHYLIEHALAHADSVDVLVCDSPEYKIPASLRANWLQTEHPSATVRIIPDIADDDNSEAWAQHTVRFLQYAPDIVFTSEDYGHAYAKFLDAQHQLVDRERVHVPIAARRIRSDVLRHWEFLRPTIRAAFCQRICVVGAESTGTTTLAQALARHYKTLWVPEYGRLYSESRSYAQSAWTHEEFTHIAQQQQALEDMLAGQSNGLLICDTNAFATSLWEERYTGSTSEAVASLARAQPPDLYFLTDVTIPFEQDGTRDGEHIRHHMHTRFVAELAKQPVAHHVVTGSPAQRLAQAIHIITNLQKEPITI